MVAYFRGQVCFPGGKINKGETIQQTALRESYEEIGLDPNAVDILGILPGAPDRMMKSLTVGKCHIFSVFCFNSEPFTLENRQIRTAIYSKKVHKMYPVNASESIFPK